MQLTCPNCRTPVEIDANQTTPPSGWACPRCRTMLPVQQQAVQQKPAAAGPSPEMEAWLRRQLEVLRAEVKDEIATELLGRAMSGFRAGSPGVSGPGSFRPSDRAKLAMIVSEDAQICSALGYALTDLGYKPETISDPREAVKRLQQTDPAVVCVDQTLGGDPQGGFKVLEWINAQPGPRRRKSYVAFISSDMKSMDLGGAFVCGANTTLNRTDSARFGEALQQGIEERDQLYRVFVEVSEEVLG